jgi:hypothetical protein
VTYHCAPARNTGAGTSYSGEDNTAKATIANLLQHLEPVLESHPIDDLSGPPAGQIVRYRHLAKKELKKDM